MSQLHEDKVRESALTVKEEAKTLTPAETQELADLRDKNK